MPKAMTEIVTVQVDYTCDKCGGQMLPANMQGQNGGVLHRCHNCNEIAHLERPHPYVIQMPAAQWQDMIRQHLEKISTAAAPQESQNPQS